MSMTSRASTDRGCQSVNDRLLRVIDVHFDPAHGTPFWLDRAAQLGIDPRRQVRTVEDLAIFGDLAADDLRHHPLLHYIPRRFHHRLDQVIIGQTAGTTSMAAAGSSAPSAGGVWSAYLSDEFDEAFVLPFIEAAAHVGFPANEQWLFIGPTGPHIIGKVVRHLAAALGSLDPFSVDFDPRWVKKLPEQSMARRRYLEHVIEQAMGVIQTQPITVLFTTPPVLEALAAVMTAPQRRRIVGVHYGGLAISPEQLRRFQTDLFPSALHLSGYGNTLMGCCLELSTEPGRPLDYFPFGSRLVLEVVDERGATVPAGEVGRVRLTRLDESMLIIRLLERDYAAAIKPPPGAPAEFRELGLRNPGPREADAPKLTIGLY
jgi:hypothetical protein